MSSTSLEAQLIDAGQSRYGRLDIPFNDAGIEGTFGPITELTEDDFDQVVTISLKGTWLAIKHEVQQCALQVTAASSSTYRRGWRKGR